MDFLHLEEIFPGGEGGVLQHTGKASNTGVVQPCKNFFIQDKMFCFNCTPVEAVSSELCCCCNIVM